MENPSPERMDRAIFRMTDSMADWTDWRERSVTSRQVDVRERSARVRDLDDDDDAVFIMSFRVLRIAVSDFRSFLKGSWVSSSESGSDRRRFFLSAILDSERGRPSRSGFDIC